jgi:hypothetical protein
LAPLGLLTRGLRLHHGYFGVAVAALAWCVPVLGIALRNLLLMVAIGLLVSDLVHHFLVLWPITGSPQFDLTYPTKRPAPSMDSDA